MNIKLHISSVTRVPTGSIALPHKRLQLSRKPNEILANAEGEPVAGLNGGSLGHHTGSLKRIVTQSQDRRRSEHSNIMSPPEPPASTDVWKLLHVASVVRQRSISNNEQPGSPCSNLDVRGCRMHIDGIYVRTPSTKKRHGGGSMAKVIVVTMLSRNQSRAAGHP